jgi:DNA invertase Pin-like site-specific DNA recombinase
MSRKVVAYVRVSTEEQAQHGYSIEVQEQVLRDYAKGHDLEIVESFVESESAYKPGRPLFAQMVEYIEGHRPVTAVLCYKIDRISRNMSDYSFLVEKLGVEILSATEDLPSNATGRLMGDMQAAFSRYFSAQLSERVKTAMEAKAKKGLYPSLAPLGYGNDNATRTIIPDPQVAPLLRELFETYANTDMSLASLVQWARKRGLTSREENPLRKSTLHKLLTNPIYVGVVRWGEVTAKGQHDPIVPQYLFDRVQEKLHGRGHIQGKHEFPFRGLLTCGYCGCQITASLIKGRYVYYHCTHGRGQCRQPYIRQETLSVRLQSIVDNVRVPEDVVARLLEEIRQGEKERDTAIRARLDRLNNEGKELERRRQGAYIDKLDGALPGDRWRELEADWSEQAAHIEQESQRLEGSLTRSGADDAREAFELLEMASELFSEQPYEEQARAMRILVSNCTLTGENVEPNYKKPFDLVAEGVRTADWYA